MRLQSLLLSSAAFSLIIALPLIPFMLNGAPLLTDSWWHISLAEGVLSSGRYVIGTDDSRWPLVNLLIAFVATTTGLPALQSSAAVPLLAGLASMPFYCLLRRLTLPRIPALLAAFFLAFSPLYATVAFTGAVMKESATYYLVMSMILLAAISVRRKAPALPSLAAPLLVGAGIALGQHYASLFTLLFLAAFSGSMLLSSVRREAAGVKPWRAMMMLAPYAALAVGWNLGNFLAGGFNLAVPLFNPVDLALIAAAFAVAWVWLLPRGVHILARLALPSLAFGTAVAGLRGGLYILGQPSIPLSVPEALGYATLCAFTVGGAAWAMGRSVRFTSSASASVRGGAIRSAAVKALVASSSALVIFAFLWGLTLPGYILLIKSLHYLSIPLAVGAGFSALYIMRRRFGKAALAFVIISLSVSAAYSTSLVLGSLSSYNASEISAAASLPAFSSQAVYCDQRASAIIGYSASHGGVPIPTSGIRQLTSPPENSSLIMFSANWEVGFLMDYDWLPTYQIVPDQGKWCRVLDSAAVRVLHG